MKTIFAAIVITGFALSASAQVAPALLQNSVKDFKLQGLNNNINLSPLTQLKTPQTPDNYFTLPAFNALPHMYGFKDAQTVYSRMPLAHLQNNTNMPIAALNASGCTLLVKRVRVADPLRQ